MASAALKPASRIDRPRPLTAAYFAMCGVVLYGGFASNNNMLYWFVGMAIGAVIVHGLIAGPPMMRARLGPVTLPPTTNVGVPTSIRVRVVNAGRKRSLRAIRVLAEFESGSGHAVAGSGGIVLVPPDASSVAGLDLTPARRGTYPRCTVRLRTQFPFGLSAKTLVFRPDATLIVLPAPAELTPADQREVREACAASDAASVEGPLREYQPGDARRQIAWRASARARKLIVRGPESQPARRVWLDIDVQTERLTRRELAAEALLARAHAIGEAIEAAGGQVGIMHGDSGVIVAGRAWREAIASLGDNARLDATAQPSARDATIRLAAAGATNAADRRAGAIA
ncbi:MAG: DUF58 domain-containing protein [Planctomycetota bacterium]